MFETYFRDDVKNFGLARTESLVQFSTFLSCCCLFQMHVLLEVYR